MLSDSEAPHQLRRISKPLHSLQPLTSRRFGALHQRLRSSRPQAPISLRVWFGCPQSLARTRVGLPCHAERPRSTPSAPTSLKTFTLPPTTRLAPLLRSSSTLTTKSSSGPCPITSASVHVLKGWVRGGQWTLVPWFPASFF